MNKFQINMTLTFFLNLIVSVCSVEYNNGEAIRCLPREREALLKFKESIKFRCGFECWHTEAGKRCRWNGLSLWEKTERDCCKWYGIRCNYTTGHVIGLQLIAGQLPDRCVMRGQMSSSLLLLHNLKVLDLIGIFFPTKIPKFIGSMTQLQHLNFSGSGFYGTVPSQLWNLTNLQSLDLSNTGLVGTIPPQIGNLVVLETLDLSENYFSGIIPPQIGNLIKLETLHLTRNRFNGTLPSEIGNLTSLWSLDLSQNQFSGTLLSNIEYLTNLRTLDLANNHFSGTLPLRVWNFTNLETLNLSKNNLTSTTIDSLFNMSTNHFAPSLRKLNLGSNKLEGLPPHIWKLPKLEELDVSFNYMEATITEADLTNLPNLKLLELSFNSLTLDISPDWTPPFQLSVIGLSGSNLGPHFPSWIRTQSNFTWLDLSLNNISGEMPLWLSSFSHEVHYLNISHNQLSGTISEFSTIRIIDVSSNKFSGPVPLFSPSTWIFQISQNMFSGSISFNCSIIYHPEVLDRFENYSTICALEVLDLSNNQLSGKLPKCWGNCHALWILNLSNNSFSGVIPSDLGSLSKLKKLHLANNNLSGELPSTLQNCKRLQLMNIGDNMLTGKIPTWIGEYSLTMAYLTLRNNWFHGSIPPQICYLGLIQLLDLSGNNLSGKIPPCIRNFTYMVDNNISIHYIPPVFSFSDRVAVFNEYTIVIWKRNFLEYGSKNIILLKLIDLSRNRLVGNIPSAFSSLKGLSSLNLSGNRLTGIIDPDIGQMSSLDSLDFSSNHLSGVIPVSMENLNFLSVLDFSNNNLSGEIPTGGNLHTFTESAYAGNIELCGNPLPPCSRDRPDIYSTNNKTQNIDENGGILSLSFIKEIGIPIVLGFIVGFWGVVGSLIVKESWRRAFYNFWSSVGDWFYVRVTVSWKKLFSRS